VPATTNNHFYYPLLLKFHGNRYEESSGDYYVYDRQCDAD